MTHGELLSLLQTVAQKAPLQGYRLFPTAFDPTDQALAAYPRAQGWEWPSCRDMLTAWDARGVMMRLPLFWQLEVPLRAACDAVPAFVFVNDSANMPLGAAAIRQAAVDTVITDVADSNTFARYLLEQGTTLPSWIIVHPLAEGLRPLDPALAKARTAQEVHLFPGVPLLVQCVHLAESQSAAFHGAEGHSIQLQGTRLLVSGSAQDLVPLSDYELPFAAREVSCPCSKPAYHID